MGRSMFSMLSAAFEPAEVRLTRREMLRAAAAAAALPLLGGAGRARAQDASGGDGVAIIGGGFAGLACAVTLADAGYSPLVLEARRRHGGRVLSFEDMIQGKVVEAGGEFIGANHPTWQAMAKRMGLELYEVPDDDGLAFPILLNGELLDKKAAEALYEEMAAAFKTLTDQARPINADEPWTSDKAAELDARTVGDWWTDLKVSDRAKRAIRVQLENDNAASLEMMSLLAMLAMIKGGGLEAYWTESETYRCKGGNAKLATALAGSLHGNRLIYTEQVTGVKLRGPSLIVSSKGGRSVNAKHVVVATPPATWDSITFEPGLAGIARVQMGTALKQLSVVKERFWIKAGRSGESLSDESPTMTWDATSGVAGPGPACLTAFAGGAGADKAIASWGSKAEPIWKGELDKIQPGYSENVTSTRILAWSLEQWTRGGYSFPAPGQVTTVVKAVREQLGEKRLWFCGEHTSSKFPGYMEGALESGVREAQRIIAADKAAKAGAPAQPAGAAR